MYNVHLVFSSILTFFLKFYLQLGILEYFIEINYFLTIIK